MGVRDPHGGEYDYITRGPVGRAVLRLAWPVLLSETLHTLFHIVDIIWVGRLGASATAAISSSFFSLWILMSLGNLISVGLTAQVSRAIGAGERSRAGRATAQAWVFAAGLGLVVAIVCWGFADELFRFMGLSGEAARPAADYLRIYAAAGPISYLYMTSSAAMRAAGETRRPMQITAIALTANALLDPLLIYGWGPLPGLGVAGAAIATVICQTGAAATFVLIALRRHPALPVEWRELVRPDPGLIATQARIGAPYFLVGSIFSINYMVFAWIAAPLGDAAVAVLGIGNRLESITYLGADGFAVAAATLVGQNLGAAQPGRAERGVRIAMAAMVTVAAGLTAVFVLVPAQLFAAFSSDPLVLELSVGYLRVLALCQVATAVEGVLSGAFAGSGDTLPPMLIHLVFGVIRPPLAWLLAVRLGMGMNGVAVTIAGTCIARALILYFIFRTGRWKHHRLPDVVPRPLPSEEAPDLAG